VSISATFVGSNALYAALEFDPENVPCSGDEALQSTRKHAACANGMRANDRDFLTYEISMIPRKIILFVYS
jgi:hypothetical protein